MTQSVMVIRVSVAVVLNFVVNWEFIVYTINNYTQLQNLSLKFSLIMLSPTIFL